MAHPDQLAGQLRFLTDAAHLMVKTATETSAYLMSRRNALLRAHDIPISDVQRQHVCASCGHIMVPGHGDVLTLEADKAARSRRSTRRRAGVGATTKAVPSRTEGLDRRGSKRQASYKKIVCTMCRAYTRIELPLPPAIVRRKPAAAAAASRAAEPVASSLHVGAANPAVDKPQPSANSSSKKRAKSRKAGLQALLSQAQRDSTKTSGLSLADFMKK